MTFRTTILASAALVLASQTALAQTPLEGFYIGGGGGWNRLTTSDFDTRAPGFEDSGETNSDNGFAIIGQLGYQFGSGLRLELEPGFRRNSFDEGTGTIDIDNLSLLANAIYEFDFGGFRPYIGVGIGGARADFENEDSGLRFEDQDVVFAYQGIVGVGYQIIPNLIAAIDYRYFRTQELELSDSLDGIGEVEIDRENVHHTVLASIRYVFGAQPAPPPPPAAPAPVAAPPPAPVAQTQTFLVFFDFDSANLTTAARDTITTAVNAVRAGGSARVEIVGHTDTSGSPQYNQRLGQRRADAVRAEMVQQGLPQSIITTASAGESQLRVPTADGVREAQNRRAEIILPPG